MSDLFKHDDDITPEDALAKCGNFLGGSWKTLSQDDFSLSVIQGGFVNRIFLCENKVAADGEPKKVILRLYGGKLIDRDHIFRNGSIMDEVLVFYAMSDAKLGPKLYGVFPEGRVEEFIENHLLNNDDVMNPSMMAAFARKLALFHNLQLPLTRKPKDYFDKIDILLPKYLEGERDYITSLEAKEEFKKAKEKYLAFDILKELEWLKELKPLIKCRKVLMHGDMNRANCLVREDQEDDFDKIVLIDYEFACYSYRGADIGMQFFNRMMDVTKMQEKFRSGLPYPTVEEQLHFIRAYKEQIKLSNFYELDEGEDGVDSDHAMLVEAQFYVLAVSIFFFLMMACDYRKFEQAGWDKIFDVFDLLGESVQRYEDRKKEFNELLANNNKN
jgi:choline/ethanolamine kinase